MDWRLIKRDGFKDLDGQQLDLLHLQDARYQFTIEASGKFPEINFIVLVQYSSHCVSWGPKRGAVIDFNVHGHERRIVDDKGVHRCFCDTRYALSINLPGIFETLVERQCLFTGYENWLTIEALDTSGDIQSYEVFFSISRKSSKMLRIYVESAYVRRGDNAANFSVQFKHRDKVRAKVLLAKKLRGEPIMRPRQRR